MEPNQPIPQPPNNQNNQNPTSPPPNPYNQPPVEPAPNPYSQVPVTPTPNPYVQAPAVPPQTPYNQPVVAPTPNPYTQTPSNPPLTNPYNQSQVPPTYTQAPTNIPSSDDQNSSILGTFYLLSILFAITTFISLWKYAPASVYRSAIGIIWIAVVLATFIVTSKLKTKNQDILTKQDKLKMILLMSFDPIIGQAIYYFVLKKTLPQTAKKAARIGWKIFAIIVVVDVALILTLGNKEKSEDSWIKVNGYNFVNDENKINADVIEVGNDESNDASMSTIKQDCVTTGSDIQSLKNIPPYPVGSLAEPTTKAENTLNSGVNDCLTALSTNNSGLLTQAANELNNGISALNTALNNLQER